jgi:2-polyprenyl-3-methyl-5-hydroxy-6-metoxy-1,4-benzoquinol methylase
MSNDELYKIFSSVRNEFPFRGYMDSKFSKYVEILAPIVAEYRRGSKVLSIGCGPCDLEAQLSRLGYVVTCVDDLKDQWHLVDGNRDKIKEFASKSGIDLIVDSAENLSDRLKERFDIVLLVDVVEHIHGGPRELLNSIISRLRSGGLLVVETPNAVSLFKRMKVLCGMSSQVGSDFLFWSIGEYRSHFREYTRKEIERILTLENLVDIRTRMTNHALREVIVKGVAHRLLLRAYGLLSGAYPNFRFTILAFAKKPDNWTPTQSSLETFSRLYPQMSIDDHVRPS